MKIKGVIYAIKFIRTFSCELYKKNKYIHTFIRPQTWYLLLTKLSPVLPLTLWFLPNCQLFTGCKEGCTQRRESHLHCFVSWMKRVFVIKTFKKIVFCDWRRNKDVLSKMMKQADLFDSWLWYWAIFFIVDVEEKKSLFCLVVFVKIRKLRKRKRKNIMRIKIFLRNRP